MRTIWRPASVKQDRGIQTDNGIAMLFPPRSVELNVSIVIAGLAPIIVTYLFLLIRLRRSVFSFSDALAVAGTYLLSYLLLAAVFFDYERLRWQGMPFSNAVSLATSAVALVFPALPLAIVFSILALCAWKAPIVRLVLVCLSLLMQALYFINLIVVLSGSEVISL